MPRPEPVDRRTPLPKWTMWKALRARYSPHLHRTDEAHLNQFDPVTPLKDLHSV